MTQFLRKKWRAILFMMLFCLLLPLGDIPVSYLRNSGIHPFQIISFRSLVVGVALLPWFLMQSSRPALPIKHLAIQSAVFTASITIWFALLNYVELAQLYAVGFLAPIFASLIAVWVYRESFYWTKLIGLAGGFCGALIVTQPGTDTISPVIFWATLCALLWAIGMVMAKSISSTSTSMQIPYLQTLFFMVVAGVLTPFFYTPIGLESWGLLAISGGIHFASFYCLFKAYRAATVTDLAPFEFSVLPFSAIMGFLFLQQIPDFWTILGGAIIFASALISTHAPKT